ncbi:Cardiolipin synthase A [Frondihabitans sp. 762G35]|uniref:PLD nuclease N-terminal domain-containing protein n=1 Tax=Frondihabitans sp. 762G35 TaxID=1446794 RepID=UPI000D203B36|nr:PLD nuclease N-terminal domain-containing protein [Frondihabitans sp. 762G35]ARC58113.1 Cardiolipin synthase A [Frondihabitans sp. 762G35]
MNADIWGPVAAVVVTAIVLIAYALFVVIAFVRAYRDRGISETARLVWLVGIVLMPFLGPLAWYLVGDRTSAIENRLRTFRP